jgi:hypothetical protein
VQITRDRIRKMNATGSTSIRQAAKGPKKGKRSATSSNTVLPFVFTSQDKLDSNQCKFMFGRSGTTFMAKDVNMAKFHELYQVEVQSRLDVIGPRVSRGGAPDTKRLRQGESAAGAASDAAP